MHPLLKLLALIKLFSSILFYIYLFIFCLHFTHCANIVPPIGGPKDSLPPIFVYANPSDSSTNVKTKKINLYFNEFIDVEKINTNLIISPNPAKPPIVEKRLNKISVTLQDSLEPNTTYILNFNNAIKDINEGNILKKFIYCFTSGNKLNNFSYKGRVILAETGKIDSNLIVILHKINMDSSIYLKPPNYYTTINNKGEFIFYGLPAGVFNGYVLPNDFLKKYIDSTQLFAFLNHPIIIDSIEKTDTFYVYNSIKKNNTVTNKNNTNKKQKFTLKYTTNLENNLHDVLQNINFKFNSKIFIKDSNNIQLFDTNLSINYPIKNIHLDTNEQIISFEYPFKLNTNYKMIIHKNFVEDTGKNQLQKSDTILFITKPDNAYSKIVFNFNKIDTSKHYLLQLVKANKIMYQQKLKKNKLIIPMMYPDNYELRFVEDLNDNEKWDKGIFTNFIKRQPEKTTSYPTIIQVKKDWDNEFEIDL